MTNGGAVILTETAVSSEDRARAAAVAQDIVVLPMRRTEDGIGVYNPALLFLVKEMRAEGVDAVFLDPPETRSFDTRKSAAIETAISIASGTGSGLLTAGIVAGLKRVLGRNPEPAARAAPLEVTVVDTVGSSGLQYSVRGSRDDVLAAIDHLDPQEVLRGSREAPEPPDAVDTTETGESS